MDAEVPFLLTGSAGTDEPPLAGVSDFRGRPVYRDTSGGWRSALFVSAVEMAACFAHFGVSSNLIAYLTGPLGHSNAAAAAAVNAWSGTANLMPLLGAFVADSWLGRYRSLLLACTLYVLGYGMITLASTLPVVHSWNNLSSGPWSQKVVLFYTSLYLIAVAQGVDKPCGLALAADQFDPGHPEERAARSSLFNWFYLCMVIGVAMAVTVVSSIQENIGWGIGFGALFVIMVFASLVFLAGTTTYRLYTPTTTISSKSPITRLAHSFSALARNSIFSFLMKEHHQREDEKDMDKSEEARSVLRMLPIWVTCLAFGLVFAQVPTMFNKQGRTLDLRMFGGGLELPPAGLRTFGPVSILVFMPIYDRVLVPALRCATGNPSGLTPLQRMGIGMALSLVAVSVAALVETRRLAIAREYGLVDDAGATVPMTWAWLVPQYVICGMSDVFAVVGMREFFYDQMPDDLRSLGLALYWGVMGVSSFISGALISLIDRVTKSGGGDSWFADNLNRAHLDYFYWLLAGVSAVELVLYLQFASSYAYIGKRLHR